MTTLAHQAAEILSTEADGPCPTSIVDVWVRTVEGRSGIATAVEDGVIYMIVNDPYVVMSVFEDGSALGPFEDPWTDWTDLLVKLRGDWTANVRFLVNVSKQCDLADTVLDTLSELPCKSMDVSWPGDTGSDEEHNA